MSQSAALTTQLIMAAQRHTQTTIYSSEAKGYDISTALQQRYTNYFQSQNKPTYLTNSSSAIGGSHNLFNGSCITLCRRIKAP